MDEANIISSIHNGIHLHLSKTDKFKTINIMLTMRVPLKEEFITSRALVSKVLLGGTCNYPNRKLLRQKLDNMYGATLSSDVQKKGDYQIITFTVGIPSYQYVSVSDSLIKDILEVMYEIIYNPLKEDGSFKSSIVEQEKQNLHQKFVSFYNEKLLYANLRLVEEMYRGEPYQYPAIGRKEDIESLNPSSIFQTYEDLLEESQFDLFIVGAFNAIEVENIVKEVFKKQHKRISIENKSTDNLSIKAPKVIKDKMDVNQGKLLLGYRTFSTIEDEDYEATRVANAIFGRFPSSRLFLNLRLKESLVYFAHSQIESNKGLLLVSAGIDSANYNRAVDIIINQEKELKEGEFTDADVEQAKIMLINLLLESHDTPLGIMDIAIQQVESGQAKNINEMIGRIKRVTKNDVIASFRKWKLDTIYFLGKEQ
ncbi:EF-P 5-aminopentanol modification-associated protein YfmF [Bacillus sp. B1-b2]|uniref:EF-P 5-aminopentanol modification-associated protein YfmF n=1 Tax=Bacillus sp. B1-b2 TaxID=2653201 RepID=UPI0012624684|nr:pitrilysin family protein [Bacillus sp. B1-b2]KAB7672201.1 insulinase family protein [Bacillus sp. B1-b2]